MEYSELEEIYKDHHSPNELCFLVAETENEPRNILFLG